MIRNACIGFLGICIATAAFAGCKKQQATIDNLKAAITGETTAGIKYAAYAVKAKEEKLNKIAKLFEAASIAEAIHAKKHTEVLEKLGARMDRIKPQFTVQSTKENLDDAVMGESHEIESMYPEYIKKANEEALGDAAASFDYAFQVEKMHRDFYRAAIDALDRNELKKLSHKYAVCPICGATFGSNVPGTCPICGAVQADFIVIK